MLAYYLLLALRSLRCNLVLTVLMVLGIALGVGASMTSLTVFYLMGADPIPWKSSKLHYVQLDNWDVNSPYRLPNEPPDQITYRDAVALMEAAKAGRQAAMYKVMLPIQPENPEVKPYLSIGRATYSDFFPMFDVPFRYGGPWDRMQDAQRSRVMVLSYETNEKLFGGGDSIGKIVRANDVDYTVVGVLKKWMPRVKFFDAANGALSGMEEAYVPFTTAIDVQLATSGNNSCFRNTESGWEAYLQSECVWMQMWVELDTPAQLAGYHAFLDSYVAEQKKLGRFERPLNNRLYDVNEFLADQQVVSRDVQIQVGLAFAFLVVCLVNTVGLLLAKFMRKTGEIGVRRALGASKPQLFAQHIVEAGMIGISGGALGLIATWFGLVAVRALYDGFDNVARLDWVMVVTTVTLSVAATVLAGLYPTWRACQIAPAAQLKTQ